MKNKIIIVLTLFLLLFSCKMEKRGLPNAKGKAYEMVIVMEKQHWKAEPGKLLRSIFYKEVDYLPQPEPEFTVTPINHSAFTSIFKQNRNIINVELGDFKKTGISYQKNVWANYQYYVLIRAKNYEEFRKIFEKNKDLLLNYFVEAEKTRLRNNYEKYPNKLVIKEIEKKYHITALIPKGYKLDVDSDDFAWISHEEGEIVQGIFIYIYPYVDTNTFTADYLIKKRNMFLEKYVHGPTYGSYMTTEMQIPVEMKAYSVDGKYYAKIKGLWKVVNDFMGGPFVSVSTVDEKRNRVVTIEGWVFYPKKEKRNLIRQLEVVCESMRVME